jgi:hypothetical protein
VPEGEGLAGWREDDGRDVGAAEGGQLAGLLEQPCTALGEAHLPRLVALDAPDLDLLPPRLGRRGAIAALPLHVRRRYG